MITIHQKDSRRSKKEPDNDEESSGTLLPIELTHIPGVIDEHVAYTESISKYPNRRTAFVGALAMMAFAAGRRYRTGDNARTNEYFVCYANSGAGKEAPRKVNVAIAGECGCSKCIGGSVGSGEGIQDALLRNAKMLLQLDEFDTLIRTIAEDKSGSRESMVRELLTEFSASDGVINKRMLSTSKDTRVGSASESCINPHLCLFGSTVGQYLFESLNERALENGLVARCIMVDCGRRQTRQNAMWRPLPKTLTDSYKHILHCDSVEGKAELQERPDVWPDMTVIGYSREAYDLNEEIMNRHDAEYDALNDGQHAAEQSFKARTGEHITKMAMIYALSEDYINPVISADALTWADKFVTHCQTAMLNNIERYTYSSQHEKNVKRVLRSMERRKSATKREITKCLRLPMQTVEEVITYLVESGQIEEIGKDTDVYHVI